MSSNINFSNEEELIDFFYANSINYFNSHKKTKILSFYLTLLTIQFTFAI